MSAKWEGKLQPSLRRSVLRFESGEFAVNETKDAKRWQYFTISFGENTDCAYQECIAKWPRKAIARVRKLLDEVEAQL